MKITNVQKAGSFVWGATIWWAAQAQFVLAAPQVPDCNPATGTVGDGARCAAPGATGTLFGVDGLFGKIINALIFLVGAVSVIMIVIGAFRMVLSSGNPANVKAARETILYAIVGVIIAVMAFAIVKFVLGTNGLGAPPAKTP